MNKIVKDLHVCDNECVSHCDACLDDFMICAIPICHNCKEVLYCAQCCCFIDFVCEFCFDNEPGPCGMIFYQKEDYKTAQILLDRATKRGEKQYAFSLYEIYFHQLDGESHSLKKAARAFYMAAEAGNVDALAVINEQFQEYYDMPKNALIKALVMQWTPRPSMRKRRITQFTGLA